MDSRLFQSNELVSRPGPQTYGVEQQRARDAEMAEASREVERLRVEMQRAQDRMQAMSSRDGPWDTPPAYDNSFAGPAYGARPSRPSASHPPALRTKSRDQGHLEDDESFIFEEDSLPGLTAEEQEQEERLLNDELAWATRPVPLSKSSSSLERPLAYPVLVPQTDPTLAAPFVRAWAPALAHHDVRLHEFVGFLDHLNVVKAASPALAAVNVAGSAIGLVPYHWFALAGMATQGVAAGATYGVARVRVTRYLARANEEFFGPRGLRVRSVKGEQALRDVLPGLKRDAPLIAPASGEEGETGRSRVMRALEAHVSRLEYEGLPVQKAEGNRHDQVSAKMMQMTESRSRKKMVKNQAKLEEGKGKEDRKLDDRSAKLEMEADKINRKADKELAKKPKDMAKIEKERSKELRKLDKELAKETNEHAKKTGKSEAGAAKFTFIVVEDWKNAEGIDERRWY